MEEEKYFFVNCHKRIITNISIVNTKIANQNTVFNSEYIIYIIKVVSPFNSWYIKKRYSEIYEIYNYLVNDKPKLDFPLFPPKRLFSTKESTVIERKNGFEDVFCFILQNIEILQYQKLIEFFKIKKALLMIYIKNCCLVNEKRFSYELMDENNSSFNSNDISLSFGSDKSYKEKKLSQSIKVKINKKIKNKQKDGNLFNKREKENIVGNNLNDVKEKEIDNNNDSININEEKNYANNIIKMSNLTKKLETYTNYFKCYEEYKLSLGNYTSRSQVSFFIIKELLRNLKVHSSHIFEIIDDFTDYIKLNNKWKKFNEKEIKALLVGINKNDLFEEYFQSILSDKNLTDKKSIITISEKSVISSTPNIIKTNNIIIKDINDNFSTNGETIENDDDNKIDSYYLEGLFYYIGNFDDNFYGARSCLLLLNRIFERDFNPEVDIYIKIFQKIDIKYIKKMNLCTLSSKNNCIYRKLCFNLLNLYIGEYNEETQIKILRELNADSLLINSFLDSTFIDESINNPYNLE